MSQINGRHHLKHTAPETGQSKARSPKEGKMQPRTWNLCNQSSLEDNGYGKRKSGSIRIQLGLTCIGSQGVGAEGILDP